ncbi:DNA-binding transcriptional MerR regulator [Kribbella antiqua]|uniref:DNA-binding transcriptional MerR regulator n=1 Tax=Kribbella antiqua TaxID=2512217 RepID=A0A4R2INN6_9ACTN|nr:DNA-binding transcriptional MerR regulator [Kribbella antiqua]
MVNIGEFARLGGVSTRMLRHYDAIGVLKPAHVDPHSNRRSYDVAQLPTLNRLIALKGLGFSLDEIGQLLGEGVDPAEMKGMLRLRQAEFERRVRHDRHVLDRVTARLRLIEQENRMNAQIETKQADAVTIAALTATAQDASPQSTGHVLRTLFEQVIERMEAVNADRTTPIARYVSVAGSPHVEIIAGYAVDAVPGLETQSLPAVEVASTIHEGPVAGIATAYQDLAHWAEANGHHPLLESPRWRHHFLEANGNDESHWIIELQLELT